MYSLVRDVRSYPEFLKWCFWSEVHEESDDHQLASLGVSAAGIKQQFKTRNQLVANQSLVMKLEEGPFRSLSGEWQFRQLGEKGSKVSLVLEFDFKPGLMSAAFQKQFSKIADLLVREFCQRADDLQAANKAGKVNA
jgi:ribosome-associated toxin RatA of RatAB toxin-antitoxin module